jgi:hypothetical protein
VIESPSTVTPEIAARVTATSLRKSPSYSPNSRRWKVTELRHGRIDPRTVLVSPQAVARDRALERGELPMSSGPRRAMTDQVRR